MEKLTGDNIDYVWWIVWIIQTKYLYDKLVFSIWKSSRIQVWIICIKFDCIYIWKTVGLQKTTWYTIDKKFSYLIFYVFILECSLV